jgi:hypothetical protein
MAKWFYVADGQEAGPIGSATLKLLAGSERLKSPVEDGSEI